MNRTDDVRYDVNKVLQPVPEVLLMLPNYVRQGLEELAEAVPGGLDPTRLHIRITLETLPAEQPGERALPPLYHCRMSLRPAVGTAGFLTVMRQMVASTPDATMQHAKVAMIPPHTHATPDRVAATIAGAIASAYAGDGDDWPTRMPETIDPAREFKIDVRPAHAWPWTNGHVQVIAVAAAPPVDPTDDLIRVLADANKRE